METLLGARQALGLESRLVERFRKEYGHDPSRITRAPGRVNLLGEHVDYNGGFVLPAAIDRATYVAFSPTDGDTSSLLALDFDQRASFSLPGLKTKTHPDGSPLGGWAAYPAGVAWSLSENGQSVQAIRAAFASDVPRGAGLSSSASVELAFAVAWMSAGGWSLPRTELAVLCQRAENKYVGVNCGIMDQFAAACGEKDRLILLDCRSLEYRLLPLPVGVDIIIADTTVRHSHTTSAYNDRRAACEQAVHLLQQDLPAITSLRDVDVEQFNGLAGKLPPQIEKRARHVVEEIDRTLRAVAMLEAGDLQGFGRAMNECHASLRDLYEVSCPEADAMARIAQGLDGCYGARITGGGFGGCTVNLVAREHSAAFVRELAARYEAETKLHPDIYVCTASAGAGLL
ncbi:MAG TPA: galactokinase [Anaerolineales bacterium]|nr:galactokinase [Anaerolineales bacterium]